MSLKLYPHNHEAYQTVEQMLEKCGKAAVIHPTGTGKSYIAFALIVSHPDKRFLWISPNEYIYRMQLEKVRASQGLILVNVVFHTYAWILRNPGKLLQEEYDYIILDEFHRAGAKRWGEGVKKVLEIFPEARVLGLTATNIRYLDRKRDMARELFGDAIASEMSVSEAMARGILPVPNYVISVYSYREKIEELQERIEGIHDKELREESQELMGRLRRSLEQAGGMNKVFSKYIKGKNEKYIVFCSNSAHMYEMISMVPEWFEEIDKHPRIYHVHTKNPESERDFYKFTHDESDHLRLLFAIDMINEGIHVDDVDGVILLRPTVSPIIYKQQIGRALATGKKKSATIFDMVNNFDSLKCIDELVKEFEEQKTIRKEYEASEYVEVEGFRIFDEIKETRQLLEQIQKNLDSSWYDYYEELKAYMKEHETRTVARRCVAENGLQLGKWLQRQKQLYRTGRLAEDRKELLVALCGTMAYENELRFEQWVELLWKYKKENGDLLVNYQYVTEEGEQLGNWCSYIRRRYHAGKLSEEIIHRLEKIGFVWDVAQESWENGYRHAKEYYEMKGNLDAGTRYVCGDGYLLGQWLATQRRIYTGKEIGRNGLTQEQIEKLDALHMRWSSRAEDRFYEYVALYQRYKEKCHTTEVPAVHREEGKPLGQWASTMRKRKKEGMLPEKWMETLESIGFLWDVTFPEWYRQYTIAKDYYEKYGNLKISAEYKKEYGNQLNLWLLHQRKLYREQRFDVLTEEKVRLLDDIGMCWEGRR